MNAINDVHSLFKMGGQPNTNILSVNPEGVVKEVLWLETEFTHCYGIDRLWLTNEWITDPILLYICKQSGGNTNAFERIFYNTMDPYKETKTLVIAEEALSLFIKMKHWVQSKEYNTLIDIVQGKPNALYTHLVLDYLKEHELEKDLEKLIEKLRTVSVQDKICVEISF
ncbi:hypothetical protein [Aquimarina mytili]|uniref:Uncharacterized protein n=1 Tax=Aquimarina mytili TaxID=874423 RepID=A0A936ZSP9_9FLAO|nr:hypothetical protein [Aquimarina mytili]MBL0683958.1 hypothetical protein [Aquimarina mytili]